MTGSFDHHSLGVETGGKSQVPAAWRYADSKDIDEFVATLEKYERGEISSDQFRAFRLCRGVYGQRQDDVQMIRIKIPLGILLADQMDVLGKVADESPRKIGHVTTRQCVQLHFIKMEEVENILRILETAGVTTRAACGNSVRNVTGDPRAGLSRHEIFDPRPFGDAITRHMLRHPFSEGLPRKFKIAITGDPNDPIMGVINDVGLTAHRGPDGSRRFKVRAGGGLSTVPTQGFVLHESYPAEHINEVIETLVRIFWDTGDRKNRHKARLKFVVRKMGQEAFMKMYQERYEQMLKDHRPPKLEIPDVLPGPVEEWTLPPFADPELQDFARTNVDRTKFAGRVFVTVRLPVGDLTGDQFRSMANLIRRYGDGTVRLMIDQNLLIPDVRVDDIPAVYAELKAMGLNKSGAYTSANITSCPGADSCKLAITHSRDMAKELVDVMDDLRVDNVRIKISGCPNSCGMHHVGTLGFHGAVRKIGDNPAPFYNVQVGGKVDANGVRFSKTIGKIPARRVQEAIRRMLKYAEENKKPGEDIADTLARSLDQLKLLIKDFTEMTDAQATKEDFIDFGAKEAFQVVTMEGECAA
jgi:sulfite reductase (ferredoxin)